MFQGGFGKQQRNVKASQVKLGCLVYLSPNEQARSSSGVAGLRSQRGESGCLRMAELALSTSQPVAAWEEEHGRS